MVIGELPTAEEMAGLDKHGRIPGAIGVRRFRGAEDRQACRATTRGELVEWASLIVLIINTLLTGVLGLAALRLRASLEDIGEELEEMNEDENESNDSVS